MDLYQRVDEAVQKGEAWRAKEILRGNIASGSYDSQLYVWAGEAAAEVETTVHSGIYCQVAGPTYETGAEARALGRMGADAVGMSTAAEALLARHCGVRVLALSTITNASGEVFAADEHQEVVAAATRAASSVGHILDSVARRLVKESAGRFGDE